MPTLFLKSPVLGPVEHGFSTRLGGVSPAPYDSLNLGKKWGDSAENVAENFRRLGAQPKLAKQVHGNRIYEPRADEDVSLVEADALIATAPMTIGVSVADCVPILFHDPETGLAAAAHAGWRGTAGRIAFHTAKRLQALGARHLRAALGPSICGKCFEVGPEVAAQFGSDASHIDLHAINAAQLREANVQHIDAAPPCTFHHPDRFFSYRRDRGVTGSHVAFMVRRH